MSDPILLVADKKQHIFDLSGFAACAQWGGSVRVLTPDDLIPLPQGSNMFFLPDRQPVGFDLEKRSFEVIPDHFAVAAFIPPGYTQLFTTAYREMKGARLLPLFSYAPVAFYKEKFYVAAVQVDRRKNHDLCGLDPKLLGKKINAFRGTPNRLIQHLAGCAQTHGCPNAVNFFLGRYEGPLPTSPVCNARCLGCISSQPKGSCPPTQPRLTFRPTAQEIAEVARIHLKTSSKAVVSFGQGCEGEPLLAAKTIKDAIRMVRAETTRGTIHMNTNASLPNELKGLFDAGLDSIRVSMNSVQKKYYDRYYSPRGYTFSDVCRSIRIAKSKGKFVALNYLVMPGFTDREDEYRALVAFIRKMNIDMIQWRNLNYDPQRYFKTICVPAQGKMIGIRNMMTLLRKKFPELKHGYFNVPKDAA